MDDKEIIKGLMGVIDSQRQTIDVLLRRLTAAENKPQLDAGMTKLESFYTWKGDLPNKLAAFYGDGSGCELSFYVGDEGGKRMYVDTSGDYDVVDTDWFIDSGFVWFVPLPDYFKIWGEGDE